MTWVVTRCVHIWPEDDIVGHELSPGCACSPAEKRTEVEDGTPSFVFTHSSLDGRELSEPAA